MKRKLSLFIILLVIALTLVACVDSSSSAEKTVTSIQVEKFSTTNYFVRTPLDLKDARILVTYSDGSNESLPVTQDMVSGYKMDNPGRQDLTITFSGKTTQIPIVVSELVLQGIRLENKTTGKGNVVINIMQGEVLDLSGYQLRLFFQEGQSAVVDRITPSMLSDFSSREKGNYTVKVHYENFSDSLVVNVAGNELKSITIGKGQKPNKETYLVGEEFKADGLAITLEYERGNTAVVSYTEQNKDDFIFEYDFQVASNLSVVRVTYLQKFTNTFTVTVRTPSVTRMLFSYPVTNENGEEIIVDGRPKSRGFLINGEQGAPSDIENMVEGDIIDWSSGTAMLIYEFGNPKIITLDDVGIQGRPSSPADISKPGNYTLYLRYGNVSWSAELSVIVHPKAPLELLLHNTSAVTDKTYIVGDTVTAAYGIKYNVLYNNGDYEFANENDIKQPADVESWKYIETNMLALGSSYLCTQPGIQEITYEFLGASKTIEITVFPRVLTKTVLVPPAKNYVLTGVATDMVDISDGYAYLTFNNNSTLSIPLYHEEIKIDYYLGDTKVETFSTDGDYTARVSYQSYENIASFSVFAREKVAESITIKNKPASTPSYFNFDGIDFSSLILEVTYTGGDTEDIIVSESFLHNPDKQGLGYQEIVIKYQGATTIYPVNIEGRRAVNIELQKSPKTVYVLGVDTELDLSEMVVNIKYNDNTQSEVRSFGNDWVVELRDTTNKHTDLNTAGKKNIKLCYNDLVLTVKIEVVINPVEKIEFYDNQPQLQYVTDGDISRRMLLVTRRGNLNTNGLTLAVYYEGRQQPVNIDLLSSYINYDKNLDLVVDGVLIRSRELTIQFGGKTAKIWIHIVERGLVDIDVYNNPTTLLYAEGQEINLMGGNITRYFDDGTSDIFSMTDASITIANYDLNPFATSEPTLMSLEQTVTIIYGGKTTEFTVTTYRKLRAVVQYNDTVSFYGNAKAPSLEIIDSIAGFTLPNWSLEYQDKGTWIQVDGKNGIYPKLPGTYPLRVNIFGNEYYESEVIENRNLMIIAKPIEVRVNRVSKIYGTTDPIFTYWIQGDRVGEDGTVTNNELIWNDGVQDKLEIILERVSGEDVKYGATGEILGYTINARLAPPSPNNQNDRYLVDFKVDELIINPMELDGVQFSTNNFYEDGRPKQITASYVINGASFIIDQRDIIYKNSMGEVLASAPIQRGNYTATISDNYVVPGVKEIPFTIY